MSKWRRKENTPGTNTNAANPSEGTSRQTNRQTVGLAYDGTREHTREDRGGRGAAPRRLPSATRRKLSHCV